jgi:hypothetical protein
MGVLDFARRAPKPDFNAAAYTLYLTDIFLHSIPVPAYARPALTEYRIYGTALMWDRQTETLQPTLLVDGSVVNGVGESVEILKVPSVAEVVGFLVGTDTPWFRTIRVMGVTPFEEQLSPGDTISVTIRGVAGCGVRWSNRYGFITAGHVASLNSPFFWNGKQIGSVVYSNNPAGHGLKVEEDAAIVEVSSSTNFTQNISTLGVVSAGDKVSIQSPNVSGMKQIQGYATVFNSPISNATYGELYLTYGQVTQLGDSGAPVLDSQGALIGHVIGGSPGVFSYIQEIHYQLRNIGSQSSFSGIQLW